MSCTCTPSACCAEPHEIHVTALRSAELRRLGLVAAYRVCDSDGTPVTEIAVMTDGSHAEAPFGRATC
jgi:hypothetical protein